jgi:uncharacterized membrane protein HdeD (DUF308 family)
MALDATTAEVSAPPSAPFWQVMLLGTVTALFGLTILAWPEETLRTLGVLVGIWLMVAGTVRIVGAFVSNRGIGPQALSATIGVILLVSGAACLRNVAKGVLVLALIIALSWLLSGMTSLVIALEASGSTRRWLMVLAVVSVAVGLAFLLWPDLTLATTVIMTGVSALVIGVGEIVFAIRLRRIRTA